jgi:hypothetical protein
MAVNRPTSDCDGPERTKNAGRLKVRRCGVAMGGALGAFVAAAAMATGSAAPAKADIDAILDPIIQPILTSLTDSIATVDPSLAVDLTSWTDSALSSLNSIDLALPGADSATSAAAASAAESAVVSPTNGTYDLPLLLTGPYLDDPAVNASIAGGTATPLLVDTGSSGLILPYTDLGSSAYTPLEGLLNLGLPTGVDESEIGGVDYLYLTYNNAPVDYLNAFGTPDLSTDGPAGIEIYSWNPSEFSSIFTNNALQTYLSGNDVDGILGIGQDNAGPLSSPFLDYGGVEVNFPYVLDQDGLGFTGIDLVVTGQDPITGGVVSSGTSVISVLESADGQAVQVTDNLDSGGGFGTIPSSLVGGATIVPAGTEITVTNTAGQELYSYSTTDDYGFDEVSDSPTVVSGTSIDSGLIPFLNHSVYIDYGSETTDISPFIP